MRNCWVSILALVMSVIALMLSYRVAPIDFKDYWGFVLGVQSLLVTILIGWQILNVFEVKRQIEDFNETISKLKKENENIIHDKISDYDLTVSALFQQLEGIRQFNSGHGKDALAFFMKSLKLLNAASDKTPIDGLVSYILGIKSENPALRRADRRARFGNRRACFEAAFVDGAQLRQNDCHCHA